MEEFGELHHGVQDRGEFCEWFPPRRSDLFPFG
jgi:hypothetical protein